MKIGVIGTFINDLIIHTDKTETRSFGGIYYALTILTHLFSREDEIFPVCWLGDDIFETIQNIFSANGNFNFVGTRRYMGKNSAVKLIYHDAESRDEILTNVLPPIDLAHARCIEAPDVWLVNFITGFEMRLDDFRQFCALKNSPVFMDFHSLSLDRDGTGLRILRKPPEWREWITDVDVLQMNEKEASVLNDGAALSDERLIRFGADVLESTHILIFNITLGSRGSVLVYKQGSTINHHVFPAANLGNAIDATGCGDAFMAGFLFRYFQNHDPVNAVKFANSIAGLNSTVLGPIGSDHIKRLLQTGI